MSATVIFPTSTKAFGNQSVVVLQDVAAPEAVSLATELGASDTLNITMFLYRGTGFQPTAEGTKGEAPARLGETVVREEHGDTRYSIADLQYLHSPQGDDTDEANKARTAMTEGTEVYLLERLGLSGEKTAYATTQKYRLHHVRLGVQVWGRTDDTAQGEFCINQPVTYIEPPINGAIAA